jgi:rubredoxin
MLSPVEACGQRPLRTPYTYIPKHLTCPEIGLHVKSVNDEQK